MLNELMPQFERLNDLWNRATQTQAQPTIQPEEPTMNQEVTRNRPVQESYAKFSNQFQTAQMNNPYGDYHSHMQANQMPAPQPGTGTPGMGTGPVSGSGKGVTAISAGQKYIGNSKYVWGGGRSQSDVENGKFDCSGFVNYAFRQAGVDLGSGNTDTIAKKGKAVSPDQMQPGDIVFFDTYKKNGHVGIYLGNGKFIGSQSKSGVAVADMSSGYFAKKFSGNVRRV